MFAFDPKHAELIYRTEGTLPGRIIMDTFVHFTRNVRPDFFQGYGALVNDKGDTWYQIRAAMNPLLLRPKAVSTFLPVIDQVAREFVQKMNAMRDAQGEMPDDFGKELGLWALESIGVFAMGRRLNVMGFEREELEDRFVNVSQLNDTYLFVYLVFSHTSGLWFSELSKILVLWALEF